MAEEDKAGVGTPNAEEVKPDAEGKFPETVPWNRYVGIKESLGRKIEAEKTKVQGLEEQLKTTVTAEEHKKVSEELTGTKKMLDDKTTELTTKVEATLSEKRATLVKRGVSEETAKGWSEKEIDAALTVEPPKPKPDLGGGGGSDQAPTGGRQKIQAGFGALHPNK